MENKGWIKLHRKLLDSPVWTSMKIPAHWKVLTVILLNAAHSPTKMYFDGNEIMLQPGQLITSISGLSALSGMGVTNDIVRGALKKFEKIGFITKEPTYSGQLITVINWDVYQCTDDDTTILTTNELPNNSQCTPNGTPNKQEVLRIKECREEDIYIVEKEPKKQIPYDDIISYLNQKAGTKYRSATNKTKTCIHARFSEGFTVDDFKTVIDRKCAEWIGTEFEKYLRPETLFGTKFESYLNANVTSTATSEYEQQNYDLLNGIL